MIQVSDDGKYWTTLPRSVDRAWFRYSRYIPQQSGVRMVLDHDPQIISKQETEKRVSIMPEPCPRCYTGYFEFQHTCGRKNDR